MASSVDNIKISPVNVYWQQYQTEIWDFDGLTKADLSGTALKFWEALDAGKHYVWFDGTGSESDPAIATFTQHEVTLGTDTPAAIATATAAIVTAITGFDATASGSQVRVIRTVVGEATESLDVDSNIAVTLSRRGRNYDLGLLQGDVETTLSPQNATITAHQTGTTPLAAINQGVECEVTTTLLETSNAQLREMYSIYGGKETPVAGTQVFGVGTVSLGKNMMVEAGRLVLKPVSAVDNTQNITYMAAIPVPDTLTLSGENPRTLSVTWQCFADRDFDSKFNIVAFGDASQTGL